MKRRERWAVGLGCAAGAGGVATFAWTRRALADPSGLLLAPGSLGLAVVALAALAGALLAGALPRAVRARLAWAASALGLLGLRGLERTATLPAGAGRPLLVVASLLAAGAWLWRRGRRESAGPPLALAVGALALALGGALAGSIAPAVIEDGLERIAYRQGTARRDMRYARRFARGVVLRETLELPRRRPLLAVTARAEGLPAPEGSCELVLTAIQGRRRFGLARPLLSRGLVRDGEQDGFVRIVAAPEGFGSGPARIEIAVAGECDRWALAELAAFDGSAGSLRERAPELSSGAPPCNERGKPCLRVAADGELRAARVLAVPGKLVTRFTPAPAPGSVVRVPVAVPDGHWTGPVTVAVELAGAGTASAATRIERGESGWTELGLVAPPAPDGWLELRVAAEAPAESVLALAEMPSPSPSAARRSLVLVSIDTLRADRVGPALTPTLARLAARGTTFSRVSATSPWTLPSHAALFASRPAGSFGGFARPETGPPRFECPTPLLAEVLAGAGYETVAFTGGVYVSAFAGFARGFSRYRDARELQDDTGPNLDRVERWLAERRGGPFFLFFHTYRVHEPYFDARVPPRAGAPGWERDALRYDEAVTAADAAVGLLLERLERAGVLADAWVVVMSDHGEEFGERAGETTGTGHGHTLYEELLHVPLLIAGPGVPAGRVVADVVSLLDVAPTLIDLAGLPAPSAWVGRSLRPLLAGETLRAAAVALEQFPWRGTDRRGVRLGATKLIVSAGDRPAEPSVAVYDLDADPGERSPRPIATCAVAEWLLPPARAGLAALTPGAPDTAMPEHLIEQLRSLGYLR